jgi:predicted ATPase
MLTRLRVSGFKNLVDIDVHFGPFTCIAGANGVGKSNLLDAIVFLSALADRPLTDAALSVRDQGAKSGDIRGLFHHVADRFDEEMNFEAEMIIPESGTDDLGQRAVASSTFVRYTIGLRYRKEEAARSMGSIEIVREELQHITLGDAARHLPFNPSLSWRSEAVKNHRRTKFYISTEGSGADRVINVHQDGGSAGRPQKLRAANLPRTVLSAANATEFPTATLVKREMQSWRLLQLEPSSLREPDNFEAPVELSSDGAHLPATLFHLAHHAPPGSLVDPDAIYINVANRVSQLIDDVRSVDVDRDERRRLFTLQVTGRDGTAHPARALSDGTLRFLALAVLSIDPDSRGVLCLEEPENGIHPERIPAMIQLLQDLTTDIREPVAPGNPIRQVIINTHSPAVVLQVPEDSLVMAECVEVSREGVSFRVLRLGCLPDTWRAKGTAMKPISKGRLLGYLNPVAFRDPDEPPRSARRVIDREDVMQYRIPFEELGH